MRVVPVNPGEAIAQNLGLSSRVFGELSSRVFDFLDDGSFSIAVSVAKLPPFLYLRNDRPIDARLTISRQNCLRLRTKLISDE
jgi:hypothetical protein